MHLKVTGESVVSVRQIKRKSCNLLQLIICVVLRMNPEYHQSCRLMLSNSKLERARKRAADIQNDPGEGHSEMCRTTQCFLCEKMEPVSEL